MADLGDIADFKNGKALPKERYLASGQWPVYGSNGEIARTDDILNAEKVISIGRVGAYCGAVYAIRTKSWVTDNAIIAEPKEGTDYDFLFYLLSSLQLNRTAIGSAQPLLTQGGLKVISLPEIPNYEQQKVIGKSLRALDDKIELNNQINETLESMAKAIFKEWFIDFGPVRTKAEGKKPLGMSAETAALFPDSYDDSELGSIPKDWKIGTTREIANVTGGYAFKSSDFSDTGHPVVKIKNISESLDVSLDDVDYIPNEIASKVPKFHLQDGALVMAMTGATVGKFGIVLHGSGLIPVLNQRVALLEPKDNGIGFLLSALLATNMYEQIVNRAEGSAQPNISADGIMDTKIIIPPKKLRESFSSLINPLFDLWKTKKKESAALKDTRDLLLPKLISGEIELKELDV